MVIIRIKCLVVYVIGILGLINTAAYAQEKKTYKTKNHFEFSASAAPENLSASLAWFHRGTVIKKIPRLTVGYGIRYTGFVAANEYYVTAPAKYTSPVQNLGTIFSKTIEANIDTVTTPTANLHSLNIALSFEYAITSRIDLGFNIDAVGFSFGPDQSFNIISSSFDPGQSPVQKGSPTRLNLLLTSDNDIGSLNSEFHLRYWANKKLGIRAGLTFLFSEYRLENNLSFDNGRIMNDRYRHKAAMAMLGITYKPF